MRMEWRVVVYDREKNTMAVVCQPTEHRNIAAAIASDYADLDVRIECRKVDPWQAEKPFVVVWTNPAMGIKRRFAFDTREEAQAKADHYAAKYGTVRGYKPPKIIETGATSS